MLRANEIYKVHVRAKPVGYFSGSWTEWSAVKTFKVDQNSAMGKSHLRVNTCTLLQSGASKSTAPYQ